MARDKTRIPCSVKTREEVLKPLKGENETYDDLFERLSRAVDGDGNMGKQETGGSCKPGGPDCRIEAVDELVHELREELRHQTDDIIAQTSRRTAEEVTSRLR